LWEEIRKNEIVYTYSKEVWFFEKLWFKKTKELHPKTLSNLLIYKQEIYYNIYYIKK
jgi:hypothetical protein